MNNELSPLQGPIFVREPYFNEPGYEKLAGTDKGKEYSRLYNDHVIHATLTHGIREQLRAPPEYFQVRELNAVMKCNNLYRTSYNGIST